MLQIMPPGPYRPLDAITITGEAATFTICDGEGRCYAESDGEELHCHLAGTLGHHVVRAFDAAGAEIDRQTLAVDCESWIEDDEGRYARLLNRLMLRINADLFGHPGKVNGIDGGMQRGFVITSRDHVHGHKALRYFYQWNREWIDAFAEHQREDGMVWDFLVRRPPEGVHFEWRWGDEFFRVVEGESIFARQPVMNDLEHMFIRGVYQTWRTTADEQWMATRVENCLRALHYATTSPYTWSEQYQLVHRTHCIDMWDFQSEFDAALVGGDAMHAVPGVSQYGVMHGDSMGLAQACDELAAMLRHLGRDAQADEVAATGAGMRERLDALAWNGEFFTHFVPEDPSFERDFGVDTDRQVSLSNAYALNRGIPHEQAVAIIKTYQRIRTETADFAPGEWSCMYPPFPRGFGGHETWHYVNGGVSPMVAGELARGACDHGFETYAVDILDRVAELAEHHGEIPRAWRGKLEDEPQRSFTTLDLRPLANTAFSGTAAGDAIAWTQEGGNDLHEMPSGRQVLHEVPLDIIDLAENPTGACVGLSSQAPYTDSVTIPVGGQAASLYILHAVHRCPTIAGTLTIRYQDGSEHSRYVQKGPHVSGWWQPSGEPRHENRDPRMLVGWEAPHPQNPRVRVGLNLWGIDNPHPDKPIRELVCRASDDGALWLLAAVTTSDHPVWFRPDGISGGIPAPWSLGAVVWAMFEGVSGISEVEPNFGVARIAPRWAASASAGGTVTAKFAEAGGYVRYRYQQHAEKLSLHATSNARERRYEILLPAGRSANAVSVDDTAQDYTLRHIESSTYVCFTTTQVEAQAIEVVLAPAT